MDIGEEYERSLSDVDHDRMIMIDFSAPAHHPSRPCDAILLEAFSLF